MDIKLQEAMRRYLRITGRRYTYASLAKAMDVSQHTLASIGSGRHRNPSLRVIEEICVALLTTPHELLELDEDTALQIDQALEKIRKQKKTARKREEKGRKRATRKKGR